MKLKIWHKMIIGISIPSFIAVLGGVLTYGYINDVKNRQGIVQVADDMKEHVLEVRRQERNFLQFKNDLHQKNLLNTINVLTDSLKDIPPEISKKIGVHEFSNIDALIHKYSGLTNELNENFQTETRIVNEVRNEGKKLEFFVAKKKHAKELSTDFVLRLRLLEKNYIFYRDRNSYSELHSSLSQIKNFTPFCYECTPYIDSVRELFKTIERSEMLAVALQSAGESMEEMTEEMAGHERQKINSFISQTQKLLLSALILLFSLGPLFVYKTASYIVAPINRLAEITRKISGGNISLRAPLKEQDETQSLAVSFNMMLDNLQQTQQSLEKSMELLREKQAQLVESEKRASMGFLVAGVAHELNNPLNNISLRAEIVKDEIKEFADERVRDYVQDIVTQSKRAHNIINNLLDFARARKSAEMAKLDLVAVTKDSLSLVANQLKVNHIKLVTDIPEDSRYVNGNRSKLEQIFISIITNAIQAMQDGGTLTVSLETDDADKNIFVKISDTGKGIPEDDLKNIFEPFFTTKPPGEGTGLGLAVSHTLLKEHQGEMNVESRVGAGTLFTIKLPLYQDAV